MHEDNFHNSKIMEFMGLIHAKINWALVGALHMSFLFRLSIVMLNEYCLIFVLHFDMHVICFVFVIAH